MSALSGFGPKICGQFSATLDLLMCCGSNISPKIKMAATPALPCLKMEPKCESLHPLKGKIQSDTHVKCYHKHLPLKGKLVAFLTLWSLTGFIMVVTDTTRELDWAAGNNVSLSLSSLVGKRKDMLTDTTAELFPSSECPSVLFLSLTIFILSISGFFFFFTVVPFVLLLPGDSDRGERCLFLFWFYSGWHTFFVPWIQTSFWKTWC